MFVRTFVRSTAVVERNGEAVAGRSRDGGGVSSREKVGNAELVGGRYRLIRAVWLSFSLLGSFDSNTRLDASGRGDILDRILHAWWGRGDVGLVPKKQWNSHANSEQ